MPPKQPQKSKAQKALAAASSSRSKGKKKWSKGKVREKKNYAVVLSGELHKKLFSEVPKKMKMITVYTMVEAYKINASVARRCIKDLAAQGKIKCISDHSAMPIYTKM
mmetsp:Transcript_24427/g.43353  ORF Transcript_24427/g.43353 Transcript_24427/m.43353 type:complete len:108 (+) Transcript_24427:845-1168(+)|eukprot:CAMPEP_0197515492 /NCGR_PEP_ID=MMETSP1318-20131121/617_1 /TAXON_ID=552666 /ORGANISM="Partenskyella glossopodia, Strain RCC365" /LENGTH=107 /DNA_ID=CAMNT_0043063885 /DNA_START=264 /DNA_END=587 /DNA_ORIENTATION=-